MRYYIYKLHFRNGCTYVGEHIEKRENDGYITSSSYYKKHKDLLESREILLECKDVDTLAFMETVCIMADKRDNPKNVNHNLGAYHSNSDFCLGRYIGEANGMYGRKHSEETRKKMSKADKGKPKYKLRGIKRPQVIEMNKSEEHKEKCKKSIEAYHNSKYFALRQDKNVIVKFQTYKMIPNRWDKFDEIEYNNQRVYTVDEVYEYFNEHNISLEHGKAALGKHWFNNGVVETYAVECPEGFEKGRLKFSKETLSNMKSAAQRVLVNGGNKHLTGRPAWNKGLHLSQKQKDKMYKKVLDIETGEIYNSKLECQEKNNLTASMFYNRLRKGKYEYITDARK